MTEDVVRAFGFLTLGSRLRRIGERLQADTQRMLGAHAGQVLPSQYPFLAALDRLGPLTIGELAEVVGISQPGVTRSVGLLVTRGLVEADPAPQDQRRKIMSLTNNGRQMVSEAKQTIWPQIEAAVTDLCGSLRGPLLEQLAAIEDGLDATPLEGRVPLPASPTGAPTIDPQPHVLDRPIWTALTTRHSGLALGGPLAKRYPGDVSLFTAAKDDSDECLTAVAALAAPDETMLMVQAGPIRLPPGFTEVSSADLVQMVASQPFIQVQDGEILPLGAGDAEEMLALATLTKPGPFSLKAQSFGDFWGLKSNGRLIAMAGERLKAPGFTELSSVCVHPDFQAKGLGRRLSLYVGGQISARGTVPFLHSYAVNTKAIGLYESIGFRVRKELKVMVVRKG